MKTLHFILIILLLLFSFSCKTYLKMNPPNDVDKTYPPGCVNNVDNSCWMATASNMLSGAGYGTGNTSQERADEIYSEMIAEFGVCNGGWIDVALDWWLSSNNNAWQNNPYDFVTMYGHTDRIPFEEQKLPQNIGKLLRACNMVGLSISWVNANGNGDRGHAITAWGDNLCKECTQINPSQIYITDSDREPASGTYTKCTYDNYTNPNPGGNNLGNGWYIDYSANHPFIKHYTTLSPISSNVIDSKFPLQLVIGSYKIYQGNEKKTANDLHYKVGTDVNILTYRTEIDWTMDMSPSITEGNPREHIIVDWDLKEKPVPYQKWITITTEFVLSRWNAIHYNDVYFTYDKTRLPFRIPDIAWKIETPIIENATKIIHVKGGYVTGEFEIVNAENNSRVATYRFIHQYSYDQHPELHKFSLVCEKGYKIRNIKFGHTYGRISNAQLWTIKEWMTNVKEEYIVDSDNPIVIEIDWKGRLPYPDPGTMPAKDSEILKKFRKK